MFQPLTYLVPEQPVNGVLSRAQLVTQAVWTENWNSRGLAVSCPTLPGDPYIEVEKTRCVRQGSDHLAFDRNRVGGDFLIERFAHCDRVVGCFVARPFGFPVAIKPETHGSHGPAILRSVLGEVKIVKQSSWILEVNRATLLLERQGGNPDRCQSSLEMSPLLAP